VFLDFIGVVYKINDIKTTLWEDRVFPVHKKLTVRDKKKELLRSIISVTKNENVLWLGFCTWRLTCILFLVAKENITLLAVRCYGDGRHLEKKENWQILAYILWIKNDECGFRFHINTVKVGTVEKRMTSSF